MATKRPESNEMLKGTLDMMVLRTLIKNNRKVKFCRLTASGRKRLTLETSRWRQMARAMALVMGETPAHGDGKA
jgi:hypothetical protein